MDVKEEKNKGVDTTNWVFWFVLIHQTLKIDRKTIAKE